MSKIEISEVAELAKQLLAPDPSKLREFIEAMNFATQPDGDEPEAPKVKKQTCVLVSDPAGILTGKDLVAWVCAIPEDASPHSLEDRIRTTAYQYNQTKKGRLLPIFTVGEALESIKAGAFRENDVWVRTKEPVYVLRTDNIIPKDSGLTVERFDPKEVLCARVDGNEKTEVYRRDGKFFVETSVNGAGVCKSCHDSETAAKEAFYLGGEQ